MPGDGGVPSPHLKLTITDLRGRMVRHAFAHLAGRASLLGTVLTPLVVAADAGVSTGGTA
jgi:hypothetical protein